MPKIYIWVLSAYVAIMDLRDYDEWQTLNKCRRVEVRAHTGHAHDFGPKEF